MNVIMRRATFVDPCGHTRKFEHFFIASRLIRYVQIPPYINVRLGLQALNGLLRLRKASFDILLNSCLIYLQIRLSKRGAKQIRKISAGVGRGYLNPKRFATQKILRMLSHLKMSRVPAGALKHRDHDEYTKRVYDLNETN